jgi:1,4-dihydroxy-2-naphthoate octaprenyltransferase
LLAAYMVPVALLWTGAAAWPVLLPLATLPLGLRYARAVGRLEGGALNPLLGATAKLLLVYGILFTLGLCFSP